jgi:thymidylate synthase ThyX
MEKSTRYVAYDTRLDNGRYRYFRDPLILDSPLGARYVGDMDRLFDAYRDLLPVLQSWFATRHPKAPGDSDFAWRQSVRAKAFDALRGMLPAAATSNLGIYASGQAYESLLVRLRAHPLPEARAYADLMLIELRKVIPSWVKRVDVADRGEAWSTYLEGNQRAMQAAADELLGPAGATDEPTVGGDPEVTLIDWDPDAEIKTIAAMLYPYSHLPEHVIEQRVAAMSIDERLGIARRYSGERANRRLKPGRALERCGYRFDVVSDYGAFRDLQRHRLLTTEWQNLTPAHGYTLPAAVLEAGGEAAYGAAMERSADLHGVLHEQFGATQAAYAVALSFRIRYVMQFNAREAMHLLELRTGPAGHPEYRKVCQQMHRLIAKEAGHPVLAEMMRWVDHADYEHDELERLVGERRAEARRERSALTES